MKEYNIKRIRHYLERFPNINSERVIEGLSLCHNHCKVNLLAEFLSAKLGFDSQLETMEAIFHHEGILTPAQLADEVHLTRSTMTSILASLEVKGYISRSIFQEDRRMITIAMTDKGIRYCEERLPVRYHDIAKAMDILSPDERRILFNAYDTIANFIERALRKGMPEITKTGPARV